MYSTKYNNCKFILDYDFTDIDNKPLKFGDKVLVVGTRRTILKTFFVGCSTSRHSLSIVDPKYTYLISHVQRNLVIKYDWMDNLSSPDILRTLQEINKQIVKELGHNPYA